MVDKLTPQSGQIVVEMEAGGVCCHAGWWRELPSEHRCLTFDAESLRATLRCMTTVVQKAIQELSGASEDVQRLVAPEILEKLNYYKSLNADLTKAEEEIRNGTAKLHGPYDTAEDVMEYLDNYNV